MSGKFRAMPLVLLTAAMTMLATFCCAQEQDHLRRPRAFGLSVSPPAQAPAAIQAPTAADATVFIAEAEAELTELAGRYNRIDWIAQTFITEDSNWLKAKVEAEFERPLGCSRQTGRSLRRGRC